MKLTETELDKFLENLSIRLTEPKPGLSAHRKMAPFLGEKEFRTFQPTADAKASSVLLLMTYFDENLHILLTLRSDKLKSHKGQISFPGGRHESSESFEETAIRETYEEVGIPSDKYRVLGSLSEIFVPPSNSVIYPYIAIIYGKPAVEVNLSEVEEVFYVPVEFLLDEKNVTREIWDISGWQVEVPFWNVGKSSHLWGATAIILSEFIELIKEISI